MNPNPNLELVYNGLVKHKLIDTSGGYDYNKFESWINENPSNLNTIYDGMVKNNLIDTKDGSYTFDNFSKWIGNVDVNKEQHLEETKEQTPATKALYNMLESKWLFGGLNQDKKDILNYVGVDSGETIDPNKLSVSGISTITAHNTLVRTVGLLGSQGTAFAEGTYNYLKNEKNRGTITENIGDLMTVDPLMKNYMLDVAEKGLESDQSPISTVLEMFNSGTPEEKQSKTKLQLAQNPGLMGAHTILKYLINGLATPVLSGLIKDTDLSPYYNNEHAKYIEHLAKEASIDNVDKESFKEKGITAFADPNFLMTEFADGVGSFTAGIIQGGVTKAATGALLVPLAKGTAYGVSGITKVIKPTSSLSRYNKAYDVARKLTDKVDLATGVTVMSIGEAAMEAQNLELSLRPLLEEKYGKLVESGELTPEEASKQIEFQLNDAQRETFIMNSGMMMFTNGIELGGVMRSFKPKGAGKYLPEKQSVFQRAKSITTTGASEMVEENLQAAIGTFEENKRIYDKYDDYGINLTRVLGEGVKGVADPAVQRAMLIGFGLGGGAQTVSEFSDYRKVKKYYDEIQPEQLKDAQILGLNSIKGIYSVDTDGNVVVDEVAKKNFMKSYLDHKNDVSFLESAVGSNNADLIDFAHNNLLAKFVQRSIEGGTDVATTLAGVESVLNGKYDPALNKSQIQEIDSDGSVITFDQFKEKKLKIAERAVATHQHVEKISKSKDITDIKHKADLFDSYNKYHFLNDKIEQLESEKSRIDDIELDANKEMVAKLDNRINNLKLLSVLYGARINDLTRDSSIKSRKIQSTIENIKINSKDEAELKANLQSAVTEGILTQSDVDKALKVEEPIPPFERPKDDLVIDQEDHEQTDKERKQLFQLKKTELQDKYGVEIYDNLDGTFETIKPVADTEEAILNAQKATEELEKLGFKQKIRTPEETSGQPVDQGLIDIDEISNPEDIDNVEETESTNIQTEEVKKRVPEVVDRYTDDDVKANPDKIFVFGDNVQRTGTGGQAQIRNNPNAFGIATKLKPSNRVDAFMSDNDLENNKKIIDSDIQKILDQNKPLVFPKDGFGTGLAKLKEKAPRTYEYLKQRLAEEFLFNNDTGEIISETEENQEEKETPKTKNPQQKPNDEAFTDSKKRDLENKVNELQDEINEGDAPNAIIEYLRSSEVWNKLAYLTRSFRQFFRVGEDSFSVTRQDFDNFVRDEIRPILNPNEYRPGKQLKVVVRDDDSMEMYIPGDVEKETTTWGKIKEQLKDGPIIGFYGEQYTYDDLVPLAILDENGNEVPLNIHITSWVTEFNVSENEEITIQDNIVKLRELRSSILANPKSLTSGVGIQITDRSNGVLFFIKDENGNNESSVLSEVAEDIDLVTFTGGTFKGTINTSKLEVSNTFHENAALGATYFIYQLNVNEKGEPVYSKAPVLNRKLSDTHKKSIKTAIEIFATGKTHEHYTLFKNAGYDLSTVKGLESYLSNFIRLTFVPKSFKTFGAYMKSLDSDHFAIHISPNGQVEFGSKLKTKSTYYLKNDTKAVLQTLDHTLDNLYFNVNAELLQNSIGGDIKLPLMDDAGFRVDTINYSSLVRENVDTQVMPLNVGELNKKPVYVATIQPKLSFSLESENIQITELERIEENMNQSEPKDVIDNIDDLDSIDGLDIPNVGYENDITNPCI